MKKIYILLTLCCALIACKKNNVDFTFLPEAPRAGETVSFSNLSSSGEEWSWSFGDGAVSTIKSPTHEYKQPGTYNVTLTVDKKSSWTATRSITVYDTVPTFTCDESEFFIYKDYTFYANVYNPYNYDISYSWVLPLNTPYAVITGGAMNSNYIQLYFTQPMEEAPIWLTIVLNGDTTVIKKTFNIQNRTTNAVLLRTPEGDYRQRIFDTRAEMPKLTSDSITARMLNDEQDTVQTYNGYVVYLSELQTVFPEMQGFHIASRKIYYRANGLWVANIDGANQVQIDEAECTAMTLDTKSNRIYWANNEGVWYMPFVGSDNNKFVTVPEQLNAMQNITKLATDNTPK